MLSKANTLEVPRAKKSIKERLSLRFAEVLGLKAMEHYKEKGKSNVYEDKVSQAASHS